MVRPAQCDDMTVGSGLLFTDVIEKMLDCVCIGISACLCVCVCVSGEAWVHDVRPVRQA